MLIQIAEIGDMYRSRLEWRTLCIHVELFMWHSHCMTTQLCKALVESDDRKVEFYTRRLVVSTCRYFIHSICTDDRDLSIFSTGTFDL